MTKEVINVSGMSCEHCVKAVTEAVSALPGIERVDVKLKKNAAKVKFDESRIGLDEIKAAIREAGFDA